MPQPTVQSSHINRPLTNISIAYIQDADAAFVFDKVFPRMLVDKKSDLFWKYSKDSFFRSDAQVRAPGTESAGTGYNLTTDNYVAEVYALHDDVPDQVIENSDAPLQPMIDSTRLVTQQMLLLQENLWVSTYFKTGVWGTDKVGGTDFAQWSDFAGSDPISDVRAGIKQVLSQTGYKPNTLTLGYEVWNVLQNHPDFVDRVKYGGTPEKPSIVNLSAMAQIFGIDRVLVAEGIVATANENNPTQTYGFIAGSNALLSYAPPAPGLRVPSAGYCFYWRGMSRGLGTPIAVKDFPMLHLESTRVEAETAVAMKLMGSDLGYFLSSAAL